ncbi:MAG: hypothetical protein CMA31_00455 [Euryarchaeota archaeon]|nr:hypothetical protein [Euryarchaeota archaeon]
MTANKSKTLCILPWIHMYANADGKVLPCCIGDYNTPLGNTQDTPIKEIWNSPAYKKLRLQMMSGDEPSVCRQCWAHERAGNSSSRMHMNKQFAKFMPFINETNPDGSLDEMKLRYMDVRWSNICNFKCRTCSATYSSSWAQEDGKENIFIFAGGENNDSLYEQFKPHYKDIEVFYFAGGEPLLTDKHYDILEYLIDNNRTDVTLRYNSNVSNLFYKKECITKLWNKFKSVQIDASLDSFGDRAEYIREGTVWSDIENNLNLIKTESPHVKLNFSTVVSVFNVITITDHLRYMEHKGFDTSNVVLYNIVDPKHYTLSILPGNLKQFAYQKIATHLQTTTSNGLINQLKGVLRYIESSEYDPEAHSKFKTYTEHYDKIRNRDFNKTFPELNGVF